MFGIVEARPIKTMKPTEIDRLQKILDRDMRKKCSGELADKIVIELELELDAHCTDLSSVAVIVTKLRHGKFFIPSI